MLASKTQIDNVKLMQEESSRDTLASLPKPIVYAHRVNSKRRAESMARRCVEFVEIDVNQRDGELVVVHGINTSGLRRSSIARVCAKVCYKLMAVGDPLLKPLSLEEYLKLFGERFRFWFDIKARGIEDRLLKLIDTYGVKKPIVISSGYYDVLKKIKELDPSIAVFLGNVSFYPVSSSIVKEVGADGISIELGFVDKRLVEMMHRDGVMVAVWTVNDIHLVPKLVELGVDIVITDYPTEVLRVLGKARG